MPTGYTGAILENPQMSFREFALRCARAIDFCVDQREDPPNAPLKLDDKPSEYRERSLRDAEEKVVKYAAMTLEEAEDLRQAGIARLEESLRETARKYAETRAIYTSMLEQVQQWQPPSPEHEGLKEFMIQQLEDSIRHDCPGEQLLEDVVNQYPQSAEQWLEERREGAARDLVYQREKYDADCDRARRRCVWKRQLLDSLGV